MVFSNDRRRKNKKKRTRASLKPRSFLAKVVGVSYKNPDGSSRQEIIEYLDIGDELFLKHDPTNRYDKNAIQVLCKEHRFFGPAIFLQIGFLDRCFAKIIAKHRKRGFLARARIKNLRGGTEEYPHIGVVVRVSFFVGAEENQSTAEKMNIGRQAGNGNSGWPAIAIITAIGVTILLLVWLAS